MNLTTKNVIDLIKKYRSPGGSGEGGGTIPPTAHNLLSASHGDTTAASVVRGDLITGQGASAKWVRLALSVPAANVLNVLGVANGETESSWKAIFDETNPTTITEGASAAPGTSLLAAHRDHTHAAPATWAATAHDLLSATHGDTTAASVVRGDIIAGKGATPKWTRLAISVPDANMLNVLGVANGNTEFSWKLLLDDTAPTSLSEGATGFSGLSLQAAHRDHTHGAPETWTATAHNILSASHGDTTVASVVRGDIITGQGSTPKWTRLALSVPAANVLNVLGIANGETESSWKAIFDATNPTTITAGASASPGTSLLAAHRDHTHGSPATWAAAAHNLLSATHGDVGVSTVSRGALITGQNSTPFWGKLLLGTNGYFLKSNGTDVVWAAHGLTYSDVGAAPAAHGVSTGYVPKASSSTAFNNTNLYQDGSGHMGVAVASGLTSLFSIYGSLCVYNDIIETFTNGNAELRINRIGYNEGLTQFRDLGVYDGKNALILFVDGSRENVGIGVYPGTFNKLDVGGDINISSGSKYKINDVQLTYSDVGAAPAAHGVSVGWFPKAASSTAFDTSYIYQDGSYHVGVGITSGLTSLLTIAGSLCVYNDICESLTNGNAEICVNRIGYNGGYTQYRDFGVYNGQGGRLLFVDGSAACVGINNSSPGYTLDVSGTVHAESFSLIYREKKNFDTVNMDSGSINCANASIFYINAGSNHGPLSITNAEAGQIIEIKNITTTYVLIQPFESDGTYKYIILGGRNSSTYGGAVRAQYDGAYWRVLSFLEAERLYS